MPQTENDRKAALVTFYREALGKGHLDLVTELFASAYVPHVPRFRSLPQLAAGVEALHARLRSSTPVPNEVKRIIADGDLVFAHVKYPGKIPVAGADIFQFDERGQVSSHWNVRQPLRADAGGGEDRFAALPPAGAAVAHDRSLLKKRVREMLVELWTKGNADLVAKFYSEGYVQHNPDMPGGFHRIREVVETDIRQYIERSGGPFPVDVHHIAVEGDLVFVHLSLFMAGINRNAGDRSTNVDIFRVDDGGRMAEHWDVLQMESEALPDGATLF